jgi:putative toxin-antitoxin system antitoxin component (TIGR02293 family)
MANFLDAALVLGLQTRSLGSEIDYLDMVDRGLPVKALDRIADVFCPKDTSFKYRIVPKASYARSKESKRLSATQSVVVTRLASVWTMALKIWKSDEATRDFLMRAHQLLGNRRPIDLILENEIGADLVKSVLGRLANGSAV